MRNCNLDIDTITPWMDSNGGEEFPFLDEAPAWQEFMKYLEKLKNLHDRENKNR